MRLGIPIPAALCGLIISMPLMAACVSTTPGIDAMHPETIRLQNDEGRPVTLDVLVADDGHERASGFQHVCAGVIDETLILFRYPDEVNGRFHMQNVHAPLDIAFFDARGKVLSVKLMETYRGDWKPLYGPARPFQFALEARAGFFAEIGVSPASSFLLLAP